MSKVKKNYFYNLLYQILLVITPVITTPYVSRVLGSEKIGIFSFTLSIATYFTLVGSLGVAMYGRREIARYQDNIKKRTAAFWQICIIRFIAIALSLLVFYFTCVTNAEYGYVYLILVLEIVASAFDITWYFQGLENFKTITIRNMIIKILSIAAIFVFVHSADDLWIYVLIHVLSSLISSLAMWVILPRYIHKSIPKVDGAKEHVGPILMMFLPQAAIQIYTVLDKTMLGFLVSDIREVGIYEQSQKIIKITLSVATSFSTVMGPHIAFLHAKKNFDGIKEELRKSFHLVWFLVLPICLGIIAISSNIVPWFLGPDFLGATTIMQIGALLMISIGLNNVTGMQYLVPTGREKAFTISVVSGAVINCVLNFILIPPLNAIGAIIASVLAELSVFLIHMFYVRPFIKFKDAFRDSFKCIIAGALMFAVAFTLSLNLAPSIVNSVIIAVSGVLTYGVALLVLREEWAVKYLKQGIGILKGERRHEEN